MLKYDPPISQTFQFNFGRIFAIWPNCAATVRLVGFIRGNWASLVYVVISGSQLDENRGGHKKVATAAAAV